MILFFQTLAVTAGLWIAFVGILMLASALAIAPTADMSRDWSAMLALVLGGWIVLSGGISVMVWAMPNTDEAAVCEPVREPVTASGDEPVPLH